jgi:hypothetical protein
MRMPIPQDKNYRTACPEPIRAKITALENAIIDYAHAAGRYGTTEDAQAARYNLERTVLTCIEKMEKTHVH